MGATDMRATQRPTTDAFLEGFGHGTPKQGAFYGDNEGSTRRALKKQRDYAYNRNGLACEDYIGEWMVGQGFQVEKSELEEDLKYDIDFYINGTPVSCKSQHTGERYGHLGLELVTMHYNASQWRKPWTRFLADYVPTELYSHWENINPGWWFPSKAERYLILQGSTLYYFAKSDIIQYLQAQGRFDRVATLSKAVLQGQGGKNTLNGYLRIKEIPELALWKLPVDGRTL